MIYPHLDRHLDREQSSKLYTEMTRFNCDMNCPHLKINKCSAQCAFYNEYLSPDGSRWFMCSDCSCDTYGQGPAND